jgi:glucose-1-phosphate thymidylyltransferase
VSTAPARELVGLVPAAGRAARLGAAESSKEILTIGRTATPHGTQRPLYACENLLAALRAAGCARAIVLRRAEKRDLEEALGDGSRFGLPLEYAVVPPTRSVPETLDHAFARTRGSEVAVGFPDVLAEPVEGLAAAVAHRRQEGADVVLALFPTDRPEKCDMVELDARARVRRIETKPRRTALELTWLFATWGPRFTALLHEVVAGGRVPTGRELGISDVLREGIERGLRVEAVSFPGGSHLDIGTADDLARARARRIGVSPAGSEGADGS